MEFRLLGPLEVEDGGRPLVLGSAKQRALLAILLLHANEVVSRDRLIDELWGEQPPASAPHSLEVYVSRLRKTLQPDGGERLLLTQGGGYLLGLEPDQLDVCCFERLVEEGRRALAAGNYERASERLADALALWRGPALGDLAYEPFARPEVERLEEQRLGAIEERIEAGLALSRHASLVAELESLSNKHPLRERLHGQLMLALYRCGRQAEALETYKELRQQLREELGLDPSPALQRLEQAILRQEPALELAAEVPAGEDGQTAVAPTSPARVERKVVTVLFADLVGFTGRAERIDPEDVRALQDPYWRHVRSELERHGGTVETFIGDAVVALFGAPVAHEDDPERAVRAALAIRDWAREQEQLEVRIAVATGEALVRLGVQPLAGEGIAAGDVINTAARLEAAAPINGILVGDRTYRATAHLIEYCQVPTVRATGKVEPIPAWEALQARSRFGVDVVQHVRTPLVGRKRELNVLTDALSRVREERVPQLITLVGVPGIGKSRLVYELAQATANDPSGLVIWRQGRSLPYGDGVSFWALAEIVKAQAGILETDAEGQAQAKLAHAVHTVIEDATEAEWVDRHLRPLAGLGGESDASGDRRSESFAAWRRLFEALADGRPTVLVFEDLHWADDGLLDFVDGLVEWVSSVPLLVVATARPELLERRPSWGGGKANATTLSLAPLSEEDTLQLVRELVEGQLLQDEAEKALVAQAAGNALYAEQFVRIWEERGRADQLPLPESVHGAIAARLDLLSPAEKALLQNAAVFGKVFWPGAVLAVGGIDRTTIDDCLHALQRKEFIERALRSSVEDQSEYTFRHVLVRDVAYSQIPRAARAEKHGRAARWIESLGRSEDLAEMLAHHYVSALEFIRLTGRSEDAFAASARNALVQAGDRALAVNAPAAAARYYKQALDLLDASDAARPQVQLQHARALFLNGDELRAEALVDARAALITARDYDGAAEADALLAEVWWLRGERERVDEYLERALALLHDRPATPAKVSLLSAIARFRMLADDNDAAIRIAGMALGMAEQLELPEVRAHTLITLGTAKYHAGDVAGEADVARGLQLALEINALVAVRRGYNNLANFAGDRGDFRRRQQLRTEARRVAERMGDSAWVRWDQGDEVSGLLRRGEWDEALRAADAFIADCEAGSPHRLESTVRALRAEMRFARGDDEGALADYRQALAFAETVEDPVILLPTLATGVRIYAGLGRIDEARAVVDRIFSHAPAAVADHAVTPLIEQRERLCLSRQQLEPYLDHMLSGSIWRQVATYMLADRFIEGAELVAESGLADFEADLRLLAGQRLIHNGDYHEATEQLEKALAFYRSVGATHYIREAEALLAASPPETAPPMPQPRA